MITFERSFDYGLIRDVAIGQTGAFDYGLIRDVAIGQTGASYQLQLSGDSAGKPSTPTRAVGSDLDAEVKRLKAIVEKSQA